MIVILKLLIDRNIRKQLRLGDIDQSSVGLDLKLLIKFTKRLVDLLMTLVSLLTIVIKQYGI